jgi:hypothetical protein
VSRHILRNNGEKPTNELRKKQRDNVKVSEQKQFIVSSTFQFFIFDLDNGNIDWD